jgi:hypothetical protein
MMVRRRVDEFHNYCEAYHGEIVPTKAELNALMPSILSLAFAGDL